MKLEYSNNTQLDSGKREVISQYISRRSHKSVVLNCITILYRTQTLKLSSPTKSRRDRRFAGRAENRKLSIKYTKIMKKNENW